MANIIIKVDYVAIPKQTASMQEQGKKLNEQLTKVYKSIEELQKSWTGARYNQLVDDFNNKLPIVNELLQLVIGEVPFILNTVANNYATADKASKVSSAAKETPKKIEKINAPKKTELRFLTNVVTPIQQNVEKNIEDAKSVMDTLEGIYGGISWQSEAAEAFKAKYTKMKTNVIQGLDNLKESFTKYMNQEKTNVENAEKSSTIT